MASTRPAPTGSDLITYAEAGRRLGVSTARVSQLVAAGKLTPIVLPDRRRPLVAARQVRTLRAQDRPRGRPKGYSPKSRKSAKAD